MPAGAAERAPGAQRGLAVEQASHGQVAADGGAPGIHRRGHRLIVLDGGKGARRTRQQAAHRRDAQALERGDREVAVEVVAVSRVDVPAQPQTRVGDQRARRRGPFGQPLHDRRCIARLDQLLEPERAGIVALAAQRQPGLDHEVVVVAGDDHQL